MNITTEVKQKVTTAILQQRKKFEGSDARYAVSLGINKSVYVQLKAGKTERLLSDASWISVARKLGVQIGNQPTWLIANTPVYAMITKQLEVCQAEGTNGIFCDRSDIGKTVAAKDYVRHHANAVYVDCSLVKTRQKLIRYIAKEFGVNHTGKYNDVFEDLVYYLKCITNPLIILDEAGDLDYPAFLELKALWNGTENHCGWYMIGADGLAAKMDKGIANRKVGFTEIFSRYGAKYQSIVPPGTEPKDHFIRSQAAMIIKANHPHSDIDAIVRKTNASLRRIRTEVLKLKRSNN